MTLLIVIECGLIGINSDFSFWSIIFHILLYEHSMSVLFAASNKITNERTNRHLKTNNTLFVITYRGLLVKTLKVFCIPSMV